MAAGGSRSADFGEAADPELTLNGTQVKAEPGGQVQVSLRIRNPGKVVESYRIDVVGLDPPWWQVLPAELSLDVGAEAAATVVLTPPKGAEAPDRPLPFGVRVVSLVDPRFSAVEEGDLEVGRVLELQAQIRPVTAKARWRTQFRLNFSNWGNAAVRLKLSAADPDDQLGFAFSQDLVHLPIGGSASVRLKVRPRKPFLRGTPVKLPFTVVADPPGSAARPASRGLPPDPSRPVIEGAVEQRPVISRGLLTAALLVVLPLVLLAGYLVRLPDVRGAGRDDAAPTGRARVTAAAVAENLVKVSWTAVDRATGYKVVQIDPASGKVGAPQGVTGGEVTFQDVEVDPEQGKACFAVLAMRGELPGKRSKTACAVLVKATLDAPTGVEAGLEEDGTLKVSWDAAAGNIAHRVIVDGQAMEVAAGGTNVTTAEPVKAGEACVRVTVLAVDGKKLSSLDAPEASKCVERPKEAPGTTGTGPPTPPETGTGTDPVSAWVARVGPYYPAPEFAETALGEAIDAGFPKSRLRLLTREDIILDQALTSLARVVAVNGFTDEQSVLDYCTNAAPPLLECTPLETGQP